MSFGLRRLGGYRIHAARAHEATTHVARQVGCINHHPSEANPFMDVAAVQGLFFRVHQTLVRVEARVAPAGNLRAPEGIRVTAGDVRMLVEAMTPSVTFFVTFAGRHVARGGGKCTARALDGRGVLDSFFWQNLGFFAISAHVFLSPDCLPVPLPPRTLKVSRTAGGQSGF